LFCPTQLMCHVIVIVYKRGDVLLLMYADLVYRT